MLTGHDHFHSIVISSQRPFVPCLIILGVVLEGSLLESSYSEAFDKTEEAVNNALT